MRRTRRASLTASLAASLVTCVAVAIPLTAVPASAAEYWNDYTVSGLPAFVTAPTPFSITVDGPDAVCGMTYADVALASAPWTFQFDPSSSERHPYVDITLCDGGRDYADVDASVPFRFADRVVNGNTGRTASVSVSNATGAPATATVTDPGGRVITTADVGESTTLKIPIKGLKRTTTYAVTISDGAGLSMTSPLTVSKGWALFSFERDGTGTFAPCSRITWSYNAKGQPASAKTLPRDIAAGLARISAITGLEFVRVDSPSDAQIRYGWRNLGAHGPSGLGSTGGAVTFNRVNFWPRDTNAGFGLIRGYLPGRGWLVIHETLHVMGFDHVNDRTQVMNPVGYMHSFGKGDLQGLHAVYPKAGCARAAA